MVVVVTGRLPLSRCHNVDVDCYYHVYIFCLVERSKTQYRTNSPADDLFSEPLTPSVESDRLGRVVEAAAIKL